MRRYLPIFLTFVLLALFQSAAVAAAPVVALQSSAPGTPFFSVRDSLRSRGYVEEEFIVTGEVRAHSSAYGAGMAGEFIGEPALYATRIVVRRPFQSRRFNGLAVVEWENVSNGFPSGNVWLAASEHLIREGYVWVGVTAQGFGGAERLKAWSQARYGELSIANSGKMAAEPYALGIFDAVGRLIRDPQGPLQSLRRPSKLIAAGQSQSGIWLATYLNAGLAADGPFDGFILSAAIGAPIVGDPSKPVLRIVPEGDVRGAEANLTIPDSSRFRQWEIAGASHVDRDLRRAREPLELRDLGRSTQAAIALTCEEPAIGTATPAKFVLHAGIEAMGRWIVSGAPPTSAQRLERHMKDGVAILAHDTDGRVVGGVRLPTYTAPIGIDVGANAGGPGCAAQGYHRGFTPAQMAEAYKSPADRMRQLRAAAKEQVQQRLLLPRDLRELFEGAQAGRW